MLAVVVAQVGIALAVVGLVSILRPLRFLGIKSRRAAGAVFVAGLALFVIGLHWPAGETRVSATQSRLDEFAPVYQFSEYHSLHVKAPPARVYQAIRAVTADEIALFRTLTSIRRFGRKGPESILNAPGKLPILDVATRTTFLQLAEAPDREIVVGTLVAAPPGFRRRDVPTPEAYAALSRPGFAKASMNFRVEADGVGGSHLTTETRVFATDDGARRRFARYWRIIYPGSAVLRRTWLRAIRTRAESRGERS